MESLIAQTKSRFNQINGIIHSAGVIKDALVLNKTPDKIAAVLAPKVYGTVYLDDVTQNEPLDFFVLFSSVAAVLGNVGQCDYAYANSFMDNFALRRSQLRREQKRFGKTLSINWSLWQGGGMHVDEQTEKWFAKSWGIQAIMPVAGLEAFIKGLAIEASQLIVISGQRHKINQSLGLESPQPENKEPRFAGETIKHQIESNVKNLASEILEINHQQLDVTENLGYFGFDSISLKEFADKLSKIFSIELLPSVFFAHSSIQSLSAYLLEEFSDQMRAFYVTEMAPAEIEGLKMAFSKLASLQSIASRQNHYCGLGSVNTNIGHLEPAAGIAGLLKVILAMQHQQLPGTLHLQTLNPYISLSDTPFYVVEKTQAWNHKTDEKGHSIPRRAGVSSFGFGGANAHVVLEEYESPKRSDIPSKIPQLVVLSAKNEERLQDYATEIINFLTSEPATDLEHFSLADMAYTLQVGRETMEERLAMVVNSLDEVHDKLTQYVQGQTEIAHFYLGNVKANKAQTELFIKGEAGEAFLKVVFEKKELNQLAQLWISGVEIDWQLLYPNQKPQRISLPTYPFARERYWIPVSEPNQKVSRDQVATISSKTPVTTQFYQSVWEPEVLEEQNVYIPQWRQ